MGVMVTGMILRYKVERVNETQIFIADKVGG